MVPGLAGEVEAAARVLSGRCAILLGWYLGRQHESRKLDGNLGIMRRFGKSDKLLLKCASQPGSK